MKTLLNEDTKCHSNWMPISDAPNCLTQIIVTDGYSIWIDQKIGCYNNDEAGVYYFNGHEDWEEVTHWMQIPTLPESK